MSIFESIPRQNGLSIGITEIHMDTFVVNIGVRGTKIAQMIFQTSQYQILSKILDHRLSLTEAAKEMFLDGGCTFYDRQIILLNIVFKEFLGLKCPSWSASFFFVFVGMKSILYEG